MKARATNVVEFASELLVFIKNVYTKYLTLFWFKFCQQSTAHFNKHRDEKLLEKKWRKKAFVD
jgi:hypothetical protein